MRILAWLVGKDTLVIHILGLLKAVPLSDIIGVNADGQLTISGRTLDIEKGMQLQRSANQALRNEALSLIREQVKYESFVGAATKAAKIDDLTFYRAALWYGQQVEKHLRILAQREDQPEV